MKRTGLEPGGHAAGLLKGEQDCIGDAWHGWVEELGQAEATPTGGGGQQDLAGGSGDCEEVRPPRWPAHLMDQLVRLSRRAPATGSPALSWALMAALSGADVQPIS